jgi:hypothetical protein
MSESPPKDDAEQPDFTVSSIHGNTVTVCRFTCPCGEPVVQDGFGQAKTGTLDETIRCPGCGREWKPSTNVEWSVQTDSEPPQEVDNNA